MAQQALQTPEAEALRQEQSWLPYLSESDPSAHHEDYGVNLGVGPCSDEGLFNK